MGRRVLPLYLGVIFLNAQGDLGVKMIFQNGVFKLLDGPQLLLWGSVVNLLMLLPFILFYPLTYRLALQVPKGEILEKGALGGVVIVLLLGVLLSWGHFWEGLLLLFGMALQSAFFSPAKYGIIRELFGDREVVGINGWVQGVTIGGILAGTLFYTLLFEWWVEEGEAKVVAQSVAPIAGVVGVTLGVEWIWARRLKRLAPPPVESREVTGGVSLSRFQWRLIFLISLFWGVSQLVIPLFNQYLKGLGVTNAIIPQGIIGLTAVGVAVGATLVRKWDRWRLGVPIGGGVLGVSLGLIPFTSNLWGLAFLALGYGIGGGLYLVPLNSMLQLSASPTLIGGVLAKSNLIQYLAMAGMLGVAIGASLLGIEARPLFWVGAVLVGGATLIWGRSFDGER